MEVPEVPDHPILNNPGNAKKPFLVRNNVYPRAKKLLQWLEFAIFVQFFPENGEMKLFSPENSGNTWEIPGKLQKITKYYQKRQKSP